MTLLLASTENRVESQIFSEEPLPADCLAGQVEAATVGRSQIDGRPAVVRKPRSVVAEPSCQPQQRSVLGRCTAGTREPEKYAVERGCVRIRRQEVSWECNAFAVG